MLRRRLTSDRQARSKNGQPHHSTTGVASASSSQWRPRGESSRSKSPTPSIVAMATTTSGRPRATLTRKRRVMSISSGFSLLGARGGRLEGHAADRAVPRLVADHLGVHRAGPPPLDRDRRRRLERHAAVRAAAGADLAHLGVHRAGVLRAGILRLLHATLEVSLRVGAELLQATGAAEAVGGAGMVQPVRRVAGDGHAADRVEVVGGRRRLQVALRRGAEAVDAPGAAEQVGGAAVLQPVRRVRADDHAADRVQADHPAGRRQRRRGCLGVVLCHAHTSLSDVSAAANSGPFFIPTDRQTK